MAVRSSVSISSSLFSVAILISISFLASGTSRQWRRSDYPNPEQEPKSCGQGAPSHICDPDDVYNRTQAQELDQMISDVLKFNKCACADASLCKDGSHVAGYPIKIALVKNISIYKNFEDEAQQFADYLRLKWSFGNCDNSIVIFYVQAFHKVFISSGEAAINRDDVIEIQNGVKPSYDKYQDLKSLLQTIIDALYNVESPKKSHRLALWIIALIVAAAVLMVILCVVIICHKCRIKPSPSTAGLPWSGTRVKIFNFGFRKKTKRIQGIPKKF